ncbi:lipopolysaccharide assembly protein LapA domain-containing protein [Pseudooceanicola aestuarii]|uniref:lipopolysaccharide assembly protein LapA domain-containing protein n=1 Tax=Pseudooceanicola aestuarii TaxID=2697319 RepID=UPI0013D28C45|nr:LapA family protein [Pseudooceanicola aestuarii]
MRYIRYAFLSALAVVLIAVALANRVIVTLHLLPEGLARVAGGNLSVNLPLFVVIFAGIVAGLLIGFFWEWLREHKHRAEARRRGGEARKLQREVKRLKGEKHQGKDEVLALLD